MITLDTLDNSKSKIIFFNNTSKKMKKSKDKRPKYVKYGLNCPM